MQNEDTTPEWIYSNIKDAAGQAEKLYFIYLGSILFVLISLSTIPDKALYLQNSTLKLPLIQSEVPVGIFVWFAPLLLVFIYIGLQVALYKVHELHKEVKFLPETERENRVFPFSLYNSLVYPESGIFGIIQTLFAELTTFYSIVFVCLTAFCVALKGREWVKESFVFTITCFAFILATYYQRRFREISNSQDNNNYADNLNGFIWGILSFCPWFIWLLAKPDFVSGLPLVWSMLAISFFMAYLGNFICLLMQSQQRKILKQKIGIILNNKYLKLSFATLLISSVYAFVLIELGSQIYPVLDNLQISIQSIKSILNPENLPLIAIILIFIILIGYFVSFIFMKLFIYWYRKDEFHIDSERWQKIQKNAKADKKVFWYFTLYTTLAESLRIILKLNQAEYDPYKTCYFFCELALLVFIIYKFYKFIKTKQNIQNTRLSTFQELKITILIALALGSFLYYSWLFLSFLIFICLWGFRRIVKSARVPKEKRNWKINCLRFLQLSPRLNKWITFILLFLYTVFFIPLKSLGISLIGLTTPMILLKLLILVILGLCFLKLVFEPIIKIKNIFSFELNHILENQESLRLKRNSLICLGSSLFACFVSFWTLSELPIYPINLRIENINQTQDKNKDKDNHNELRNERELYLPWKAALEIRNVKIVGKTNEPLILDRSTIHNLDLSELEIEPADKSFGKKNFVKRYNYYKVLQSNIKIGQDLLNNIGQWLKYENWGDKFFQVGIKEMETQKEEFITYTPAISLRDATISGTIKFQSNVKKVKVDLTNADLRRANLTEADLESAKLTETKLKDSILINANLKGTESRGILVCGLVVDQLCEAISIWNTRLDEDLLEEVKKEPACKNKLQFPSKELIEDADIKLEEIIENQDLSDADLYGSEWIPDKSIFCKASKLPANSKDKIPDNLKEYIKNKCPDKLK